MEKIVLGLSGGVDSSVAASLLLQGGYRVHGLYLDIGQPGGADGAREAAEAQKIPLEVRDIRQLLEERVCVPFADAYLHGETPNPCIMCNPAVKFKTLLEFADEIGAPFAATGHYARAESGALFKGLPANDQSYMLCRLTRAQVSRLILPLGGYEKIQVRELAEQLGLPAARKPDSMEICFIPDGDYAAFIESRGKAQGPGNFIDAHGAVLGRHKGIHHYTVGQRRGLGIAAGKRVFVSEIRPVTNEVVLSDGGDLMAVSLLARDMNWLCGTPERELFCDVKIRHSKIQTRARVKVFEDMIEAVFETAVRAPVAGQSAALYDADRLLGGGYIV